MPIEQCLLNCEEVELAPCQGGEHLGEAFPCFDFVEGAEKHNAEALLLERLVAFLDDILEDVLGDTVEYAEDICERVLLQDGIIGPF